MEGMTARDLFQYLASRGAEDLILQIGIDDEDVVSDLAISIYGDRVIIYP